MNHQYKRLWIKHTNARVLLTVLMFAGLVALIPGCGSDLKLGDVDAVKQANELAIDCKTNEALAAVDRAVQGGGLGAGLGDLQRVVILRDAGRLQEADEAMAARNKKWNVNEENALKAEKAVAKSIQQLRDERQKRTGNPTCQ